MVLRVNSNSSASLNMVFAAAVTFFASERASYITGTSLAVDGGWIKHIL